MASRTLEEVVSNIHNCTRRLSWRYVRYQQEWNDIGHGRRMVSISPPIEATLWYPDLRARQYGLSNGPNLYHKPGTENLRCSRTLCGPLGLSHRVAQRLKRPSTKPTAMKSGSPLTLRWSVRTLSSGHTDCTETFLFAPVWTWVSARQVDLFSRHWFTWRRAATSCCGHDIWTYQWLGPCRYV